MKQHSSIVGGVILILVGLFFLAIQFFPGWLSFIDFANYWPFIIVGVGGLFLVAAIAGTPALAIPGSIVGGIGLLLLWQNISGNWASWAYAWALIPGFVGVGQLLFNLLDPPSRSGRVREGRHLITISAIMFVIAFVFFNGLPILGNFWPVLLILGGVVLLWRQRNGRKSKLPLEK